MKKLLVTGASGFLGWNVCNSAAKDWDIRGTVFSHRVEIEGVKTARADLTDFEAVKRLFQEIRPDAVSPQLRVAIVSDIVILSEAKNLNAL
ncbi:MAG: NAD-dependent epimerase/dehydratase family protein [Nitrospirae bacterium]|nr:NAD-dependent epimerase/dehydratase family protein [Nitrospirota bacterium]